MVQRNFNANCNLQFIVKCNLKKNMILSPPDPYSPLLTCAMMLLFWGCWMEWRPHAVNTLYYMYLLSIPELMMYNL